LALKYSDLMDILLQRAQRLELVDADSRKADTAELELYLFQSLLSIVELVDIPVYMNQNPTIVTTKTGIPNYPMPDNYGRLIMPRVQNKRGIYLFDTLQNIELTYIDPNVFTRQVSLQNGRPSQFTVMQRTLWLYPTPDSNSGHNYTIRGIYMQRIDRPQLTDEVILPYPSALVEEALFRLASDMNKANASLIGTRTAALTLLVGGSK
jgi:hypothetical protein